MSCAVPPSGLCRLNRETRSRAGVALDLLCESSSAAPSSSARSPGSFSKSFEAVGSSQTPAERLRSSSGAISDLHRTALLEIAILGKLKALNRDGGRRRRPGAFLFLPDMRTASQPIVSETERSLQQQMSRRSDDEPGYGQAPPLRRAAPRSSAASPGQSPPLRRLARTRAKTCIRRRRRGPARPTVTACRPCSSRA
jgi:hypothetical protein